MPYELTAADLEEAEPQAMLLLVTYLFTALPQLLPQATLEFECGLGDKQVNLTTLCHKVLNSVPAELVHSGMLTGLR